MGFCGKFRNITVLIFNIIFLLVGIGMIVIGAISKTNMNDLNKVIPPSYHYLSATPTILLVLGSIVILVSIFGTIGVVKWNLFLLNTYTVFLIIIFLLHIILSISTFWAVTNHNDFAVTVNNTVETVFKDYSDNMDVINFMQSKFECCGTSGPTFWKNQPLPKSCFHDDKKLYQQGCQIAFFQFLSWTIRFSGTVILALAPLQVIGATFSQSLVNSIRNYDRVYGKYNR